MIISRTPFRMSFFGGGTDYPTWYREHGGAVLSATINHYCYITCRYLPPFFEHKSRVVWSRIETVGENHEIEHPVVRAALQLMRIDQGVEVHHDADLPSRTGLGSSSAFSVGILHALHALRGEMISKREMAKLAIHVEQTMLGEAVGVQDQIAAAHGGFNHIQIFPDDNFTVQPLAFGSNTLRCLQQRLLMFYTGVSRTASEVAKEQIAGIPRHQGELHRMREMVDEAMAILARGRSIDDFGRLLHEAWQIKRALSAKVSPRFIDDIYERAIQAGALGGKLMGAGGGGFMMFYVPIERQPDVLDALRDLLAVPVEFESHGSQLIFFEREGGTLPSRLLRGSSDADAAGGAHPTEALRLLAGQ